MSSENYSAVTINSVVHSMVINTRGIVKPNLVINSDQILGNLLRKTVLITGALNPYMQHRFIYVGNNPVCFNDPQGLTKKEWYEHGIGEWFWHCESGMCLRIRKVRTYEQLNWKGKVQWWTWFIYSHWNVIPGLPGQFPGGNPISNPCYEIDEKTPPMFDRDFDGVPDYQDRAVIAIRPLIYQLDSYIDVLKIKKLVLLSKEEGVN